MQRISSVSRLERMQRCGQCSTNTLKLCIDVAPSLDAVGQQRAAQHLIDLTGLLLGAGGDCTEFATKRGYSDSRFDLIKSNVLKNLHRHNLTIDLVARSQSTTGAALFCSFRYNVY